MQLANRHMLRVKVRTIIICEPELQSAWASSC